MRFNIRDIGTEESTWIVKLQFATIACAIICQAVYVIYKCCDQMCGTCNSMWSNAMTGWAAQKNRKILKYQQRCKIQQVQAACSVHFKVYYVHRSRYARWSLLNCVLCTFLFVLIAIMLDMKCWTDKIALFWLEQKAAHHMDSNARTKMNDLHCVD